MIKKYLLAFVIFLVCLSKSYSYDLFETSKTFDELLKNIHSLPVEERLKIEIINHINEGQIEKARELFDIFKIFKLDVPPEVKIISNIIYIPPQKYAVVVSKKRQQLKVFTNEDGRFMELISDSCITGKKPGDKLKEGDQRTPNGVYFPMYFIPPHKLSEIYGHGAFPLNYPNIIDKLIFHKTGDGIWLHGTNDDNRPPFSSNGCVVMKNNLFDYVSDFLLFKETPVVIVDDYSYVSGDKFNNLRKELILFLYSWKIAWENTAKGKNLDKYFSFYSEKMVSTYGELKRFKRHKTRVAKNKKWINIKISDVYITKDGKVLNYGDIYVISFSMRYKSNNYNWKGKKILYIIKEQGRWKILAEESL